MHQNYIIFSEIRDMYYVGSTSVGLETRLERHNKGQTKSTKSGIPWEIKYCKSFATKPEAIKWEKFIKRQKSRKFIEKLIASEENECG